MVGKANHKEIIHIHKCTSAFWSRYYPWISFCLGRWVLIPVKHWAVFMPLVLFYEASAVDAVDTCSVLSLLRISSTLWLCDLQGKLIDLIWQDVVAMVVSVSMLWEKLNFVMNNKYLYKQIGIQEEKMWSCGYALEFGKFLCIWQTKGLIISHLNE